MLQLFLRLDLNGVRDDELVFLRLLHLWLEFLGRDVEVGLTRLVVTLVLLLIDLLGDFLRSSALVLIPPAERRNLLRLFLWLVLLESLGILVLLEVALVVSASPMSPEVLLSFDKGGCLESLLDLLSLVIGENLAAVIVDFSLQLHSGVEGVVEQVKKGRVVLLLQTALEQSLVGDGVRLNAFSLHVLEETESSLKLVRLYAGLNQAGVNDDTWLHSRHLHLVDDHQCLCKLLLLPINLDKDGESDVGRPYPETLHVFVDLERHLELIALAAAIEKRVVEDFIRLDSSGLHFLHEGERLLDLLVLAETLDKGGVGDEIWLRGRVLHLLHQLLSLLQVVTADATVD